MTTQTDVTSAAADAVRAEATEYRQGEDRPLGGYVAVMGVFGALLAAAIGVGAARRTRVPAGLRPLDVVLITLGTHKLSRTITKDAVTSPLRAAFTTYDSTGGPAEVMERPRTRGAFRHAVGELLTCPFCLDLWIAAGFMVGMVFAPRGTRLVATTFTVLTGADFLQLAYAWAQQRTEKASET